MTKNVFLLYAVAFINHMALTLGIAVLSPLLLVSHWRFAASMVVVHHPVMFLSLVLAAKPLAEFVFAPVVGFIADRYRYKTTLLVNLMIGAIAMLAIAVAIDIKSMALLVMAQLLAGVAAASVALVQAGVVNSVEQKQRMRSVTNLEFAIGLGLLAGPILGDRLATLSWFGLPSYTLPFILSALLFVGLSLLWAICFVTPSINMEKVKFKRLAFWRLYQQGQFNYVLLVWGVFMLGWQLYFRWLPTLLIQKFGMGPSGLSQFFLLFGGCYISYQWLVVRRISNKLASMRLLTWALVITGLSFCLLPLASHLWQFELIMLLYLLGGVSIAMPIWLMVVSRTGDSVRGQRYGSLASLSALASLLASVFGVLAVYSVNIVMVVAGLLVLCSAGLGRRISL